MSNHWVFCSPGTAEHSRNSACGKTQRKEGNLWKRVRPSELLERVSDQAKFWALSPRPWRKTTVWVWGSVGWMMRGRLIVVG